MAARARLMLAAAALLALGLGAAAWWFLLAQEPAPSRQHARAQGSVSAITTRDRPGPVGSASFTAPAAASAAPAPEGIDRGARLEWDRENGVSGRTLDPDGRPIAGARVVAHLASREASFRGETRSDADGVFRFDLETSALEPGSRLPMDWGELGIIMAEAPGQRGHQHVYGLGPHDEEITLRPIHTIPGRVVAAEDERPIANARVFTRVSLPWPELAAASDASGRFALPCWCASGSDSGHTAFASAPGWTDGQGEADGAAEVVVRLAPGGSLSGSVRGPDGRLLPQAAVQVSGRHAQTDERGEWQIEGLSPGRHEVQAGWSGEFEFAGEWAMPSIAGASAAVELPAGAAVRLDLQLRALGRVQVNARTRDGLSVSGLVVRADTQVEPTRTTQKLWLRPQVFGALLAVPVGPCTLSVEDGRGGKLASATCVALEHDVVTVELLLDQGVTRIEAQVVDAAARPLAGVELKLLQGGRSVVAALTDEAGQVLFATAGLAPGPAWLVVEDVQRGSACVGFEAGLPTAAPLRVVTSSAATVVHGRLLGLDGQPAVDVALELDWLPEPGGARSESATVREDGSFEVAVFPGRRRISASSDAPPAHLPELTVELAAGERRDLGTLRLVPGQLSSPPDSPAAGPRPPR